MIICNVCNQQLHAAAFYPTKVGPNTRRSRCKKCSSASARAWNIAHPDRVKKSKSRHQPRAKKQISDWGKCNRAHLTEYMRKWRENNRATVNKIAAGCRKRNKDSIRVSKRIDMAKRRGRTPVWADKIAIRAIYEEADRIRKETGADVHVDHIIPLNGKMVCGLHVENNLRIVPKMVNLRKHNKLEETEQ